MSRIRVLITATGVALVVAVPAFAQSPPPHSTPAPAKALTRTQVMNMMENGARFFSQMIIAPNGRATYRVDRCTYGKTPKCRITTHSRNERCTLTGRVRPEPGSPDGLFWMRDVTCERRS